MRKTTRGALILLAMLVILACNVPGCNPGAIDQPSPLRLTVEIQNAGETFNSVGQTIRYDYIVTNGGTTRLAGPVSVNDPPRQVSCPELNTIGNLDAFLDPGESITCTSSYAITQNDLTLGSVINSATAMAGGINSAPASVTVTLSAASVLRLTKTANPTTYNQIGQTITYTYVITNTGTATLGPIQFTITDNRLGTPFACGDTNTTLTTNQTVTCTMTYTITQADMTAASVTNSATASATGVPASQPATATVTNLNLVTATPSTPSSNITPGATVIHRVVRGEWMLQIARCYGAVYKEVRDANPHIKDPDFILPGETVTVPRVGSVGTPFAPNCVTAHTVQSGDTWQSIAQRYNADVVILQTRNPGALAAGRIVYVPNNTASGSSPLPTTQPTTQPAQPTRLTIPAGQTSVTQQGTLAPLAIARYVINATQGQTMTVTVTAPANQAIMAIYNPAGTALKAADATLTWTGVVPQTGDYRIDIASTSTTANTVFTLTVSLTGPTQETASATPTPTSTSTTPISTTQTSTTPVSSGTFQQAADVNTGSGNSSPAYLVEYNGGLYFQADGNDGMGKELWRYDGTTASRAADINAGANSSNPSFLTVYNGALYFAATGSDGVGNELWRFDGTTATRAADIRSGAESSNPASLAVLNGVLYFGADGNDGAGYELWKFDGTTASRAADILTGPEDSVPAYLTVFNNALYMQANGGDGMGYELWRFDGTNASRVADLWTGSGNSNPSYLAVYNGALYFSANGNDGAGVELWRHDGTATTRAADVAAGGDSYPSYLTVYNGALYFNANGNDGGGQRLWRYDGTSASRVPEPSGTNISAPAFLAVYRNALYFQANGNNGAGVELWRYTA